MLQWRLPHWPVECTSSGWVEEGAKCSFSTLDPHTPRATLDPPSDKLAAWRPSVQNNIKKCVISSGVHGRLHRRVGPQTGGISDGGLQETPDGGLDHTQVPPRHYRWLCAHLCEVEQTSAYVQPAHRREMGQTEATLFPILTNSKLTPTLSYPLILHNCPLIVYYIYISSSLNWTFPKYYSQQFGIMKRFFDRFKDFRPSTGYEFWDK